MDSHGIDIIPYGSEGKTRLCAALGFFDCIHTGHGALLAEAVRQAAENDATPALFTFGNDPFALLGNGKKPVLTFDERLRELEKTGIKTVIAAEFDERLMKTSGAVFFDGLIKTGVVGVVCGRDYTCGVRGETDATALKDMAKEKGVAFEVVGDVFIGGEKVSSSAIRKALAAGDIEKADEFLGRPYIIGSDVIKGDGLGKTFGFPTANLSVPAGKFLPKEGVYAAETEIGGRRFKAAVHIGIRPTLGSDELRIEAFLPDFDGNLYGKQLYLGLTRRIRDVMKFDSVEELKARIRLDVKSVTDGQP